MARTDFAQRRDIDPASRLGIVAACMRSTPRRIDRARDVALQQLFLALQLRVGDRHRRQQGLGGGVQRVVNRGALVDLQRLADDIAGRHTGLRPQRQPNEL